MHTEPRPSSVIVPSASTIAESPETEKRRPFTVTNVAADFSGILVVAQRHVAAARHAPDDARTRLHDVHVVVEHDRVGTHLHGRQPRRLLAALHDHAHAVVTGLGRADRVGDDRFGKRSWNCAFTVALNTAAVDATATSDDAS